MDRKKFFIFSDESGSWHDTNDLYIRSWVVIEENEYQRLLGKVDEVASLIGANELKWTSFVHNPKFIYAFNGISFRVFVTVSSPKDINWNKYRLLRNFDANLQSFDFGNLSDGLKGYIKERIHRDLKNALFLHFYERYHIENAKNAIERIIKPKDFDLIYRIDPPQMSQEGWRNVIQGVSQSSNVNLEFPTSNRTQGIQFADVIAGCFRSLMIKDSKLEIAKLFIKEIKDRIIPKNKVYPNPNLIFFAEVNDLIKSNCASIWRY